MVKKIIAGTIICTVLGTSNIMAYATNTGTTQGEKDGKKNTETVKQVFEVSLPEKEYVTNKNHIVLSFKGPKDTKVSIKVYHNALKDGNEENYVLSYDPIELFIGDMQMGWAELELKSGLNRIKFVAEYKDGLSNSIVRHVNVMNVEEVKQLLENIVSKPIIGIGKR